jgi:hypothetical protein
LDRSQHVWAFFHSEDEEDRVLTSLIEEGIDLGDKACLVVNPALRHKHVWHLQNAGIDTTAFLGSGQLEVRA